LHIVEDMYKLDNLFDISRINRRVNIFFNVRDTYDFEIGFELGKIGGHNILNFNQVNVLDVFLNCAEVQIRSNLVCSNDETTMIIAYKVCQNFKLNTLQCSVDVSNVVS